MHQWTDEFLNAHRFVGDPLADGLVKALFDEHGIDMVNTLMQHLVDNAELNTEGLPFIVEEFLKKSAQLPDWADAVQLAKGSDFFAFHGPEIVMMLFCVSLPVLYANPHGAEVLILTQRMTTRLYRRIVETAQFVMDVTAPNAFAPNGHGVNTTQKVRLLHAATRYFIDQHKDWQPQWDKSWGTPVNQTDLAGTMLSFSTTILLSMEKSGVKMTSEEKEAFLHLWKVIGHVLGIQDDLMPDDVPDSIALMEKWTKLYHAPSATGIELTQVLLKLLGSLLVFPGSTNLVTNWTRFWIGDGLADWLGVGPYGWTRIIQNIQLRLWRYSERIDNSSRAIHRLAGWLNRRLLVGLLDVERGGNRPPFNIPDHLRDAL